MRAPKAFSYPSPCVAKQGFSLIEVTIVLVVIGLILGGVMIGRDLIQTTENKGMLADARAIAQGLRQFESTYNAKPGDMSDASAVLPGAPPGGDGNGAVETANANGDNEQGLLWLHLEAADMLPRGVRLDNVATRFQAQSGKNKGVGYQVQDVPGMGMGMILSSYAGAAAGEGAFTPADAAGIDGSLDDGKPETGFIRGRDGIDAAGLCVVGGVYNESEPRTACQLVYLLQSDALNTTDEQDENVACGKIGQQRLAAPPAGNCPAGFIGQIWETCMADGVWRLSHKDCKAVQCDETATVGQTRTIGCGLGYDGAIEQRCSEGGVWVNGTVNCTLVVEGEPCAYDRMTKTVPCPVFKSGARHLSCIGGVWVAQEGSCTDIQCGSDTIGASKEESCPSGFSGKVVKTCTAAGIWHTSLVDCYPSTGEGCATLGDTRTLACPYDASGEIIQSCMPMGGGSGEWVMTHSSCDATAHCGNQPIGAVRNTTQACPPGKAGTYLEICGEDGTWQQSDTACTQIKCLPQAGFGDGNASWPSSVADGTTEVTGTCVSGMGAPRRVCQLDGSWGPVISGTQCGSNCLLSHVPGFDTLRMTPDVGTTVYPDTTSVNFVCKAGYTGPGGNLTCMAGSWDGNGPTCRKSCSPTEPHNSTRCNVSVAQRCIEGLWKACTGTGCPSC